MPLKIIGTGMGRTGTHSLKLALEQLGFGKCYHMAELFENPHGLVYFEKAERGEDVDWVHVVRQRPIEPACEPPDNSGRHVALKALQPAMRDGAARDRVCVIVTEGLLTFLEDLDQPGDYLLYVHVGPPSCKIILPDVRFPGKWSS